MPDTLSAGDLDKLLRKISMDVYQKHHVILTAVGVYSVNTRDPEAVEAQEKVRKMVMENPYVLQMHGFYLDKQEKTIRFDLVISFDAPDRAAVHREICEKVHKLYPDYTPEIAMDTDFSE